MSYNSFIEYLIECGFIDPKDGKFKYLIPKNIITGQNIQDVVICLKETLRTLKSKPNHFTIATRDINATTIKKVLKLENDTREDKVFCNDPEIKSQVIDYISDISLEKYFNKSEKSDNGFGGWIYVFIVPNHFDKYQHIVGPRSHKVCKGKMLYLKFNFKTYEDDGNNIKIDPKSILLDNVSMHPTTSSK